MNDQRSLRCDDPTWDGAKVRADREGRTVSDVIRAALRAYAAGEYDAITPPRRTP